MFSHEINARIERIDRANLRAIALMGSYARGDAGKYSDIDIVRFLAEDAEGHPPQIEIIDGKYLVISSVSELDVDEWFTTPEKATAYLGGLWSLQPIWDFSGYLAGLQKRALEFQWNESLQMQANHYASKSLLGWVEEVHKALQGVLAADVGRMLNGLHGLTFGLFDVVRVQQGILLSGENSFFEQITDHFGQQSEFTCLSRIAFGLEPTNGLMQRVVAGLRLFCLVVDLLTDVLSEEDKVGIVLAADEIQRELGC